MIIFHEGLPGSGKSYEAMAERVIPALKAGREVVAYVEGIDHAKIAELCTITEERSRALLHTITREQMRTEWLKHCRDNALHVFDEAQNFWGNRTKLNEEQTQLVTEHRHRGMDIVLMGQDLRDVNATWRRRVELKLCFLKLNGLKLPKFLQALTFNKIGTEAGYSVTTYRHLGGDQFSRMGMTMRTYNPKYFGTYASHVSEETNTDTYTDKRAQVWNHPLIKYAIPLAIVGALWGAYNAWSFFHPKVAETQKEPHPGATTATAAPADATTAQPSTMQGAPTAATAAAADNRSPIEKRMVELGNKGRIRLAGLIRSKDRISGIVEWVQGGNVVIERLSLDALRSLGVAVLVTDDVVQLAAGDYRELATPWPLEDLGRMTEARTEQIRGPRPLSGNDPAQAQMPTTALAPAPDLPGPLAWSGQPRTPDEDAGSIQRRVRRVAQ